MREKINYENRWVAFIDILGYSELLKDQSKLTRIYEIINLISSKVADMKSTDTIFCSDEEDDDTVIRFDYQFFSDTIIISMRDCINCEVMEFLLKINSFIKELMKNDAYVRGGIVYDSLYHNDSSCFGPAVVNAYYMERNNAIYPRIIICNKLYDEYVLRINNRNNSWDSEFNDNDNFAISENKIYKYLLLKEKDGFHSINPFYTQWMFIEDEGSYKKYCAELQSLKNNIVKQIEINKNDEHILQKYIYIKSQFNDFCCLLRKDFKLLFNNNFDANRLPLNIN